MNTLRQKVQHLAIYLEKQINLELNFVEEVDKLWSLSFNEIEYSETNSLMKYIKNELGNAYILKLVEEIQTELANVDDNEIWWLNSNYELFEFSKEKITIRFVAIENIQDKIYDMARSIMKSKMKGAFNE